MKCPKCSYLSFEASDRCRNCGYDFSLASTTPPAADATIESADDNLQPLDLSLAAPTPQPPVDLDRLIGLPARPDADLPLFARRRDAEDDRPLVEAPATPRAPLAVRRAAETARLRSVKPRAERAELPLDLAIEERKPASPRGQPSDAPTIASWMPETAGWIRRVVAALLDAAIVTGIDALVIYFTLQVCGLTAREARALPPAPMIAFLLLLNGGYFVAFTAIGGQTIGKMATAIQVIGDGGPVDFSRAALRAAAYLVSLLPGGLGIIPAFFGEGRRTLHDRLADTRVVRA
jgi:uncharacterized RDD family membrane protein YckC